MFLREHLRMGDQRYVEMEGRRLYNQRKNRKSYTERSFNMYENGKVFFYEFRSQGQNVFDVVSSLAKCSYGPTHDTSRNVAMGTLSFSDRHH